MDTLLEIIKITVPALIVFLTVYYLQKAFYQNQLQAQSMKINADKKDALLPQKIQAYERLALLCDRIKIPALIYRLRTEGSGPKELATAMNIAIQQELNHNTTQQLYISHNLWNIITLAADQTKAIITQASSELSENATIEDFVDQIMSVSSEMEFNPLDRALYAINEEVKLLS